MIFRTTWSSIHLFGQEYMFSFAHMVDIDFSFHWKNDWQVCDSENDHKHRYYSWKDG